MRSRPGAAIVLRSYAFKQILPAADKKLASATTTTNPPPANSYRRSSAEANPRTSHRLATATTRVTLPRHRNHTEEIIPNIITCADVPPTAATIRPLRAAASAAAESATAADRRFCERHSANASLMCKLIINCQSRVVIFYRKPRYTHYCSVWNIILGELYQKCSI